MSTLDWEIKTCVGNLVPVGVGVHPVHHASIVQGSVGPLAPNTFERGELIRGGGVLFCMLQHNHMSWFPVHKLHLVGILQEWAKWPVCWQL